MEENNNWWSEFRTRLGKWEFPILLGITLVIVVIVISFLPNTEAVKREATRWVWSVFLHALLLLGAPIIGAVFATSIQYIDDMLSPQHEIGHWGEFFLSLAAAVIVGCIWMLMLPWMVSNPEIAATFADWDRPTAWEIVPWGWGIYAAGTFETAYVIGAFMKSMSYS